MCNHAYIFCANNAANVLALSYVRKARRLALYLEQQESIGQEVTEEALVHICELRRGGVWSSAREL